MKDTQHVTKHPEGGWQVKKSNSTKATRRTKTQIEAIDIAREIAKKQKTELFIHSEKGTIRERDSYGNDPRNIKG